MVDAVTKEREAFQKRLAVWAKANGYKRRGGVWRTADHYILIARANNDEPFHAERRAFGSGRLLSII